MTNLVILLAALLVPDVYTVQFENEWVRVTRAVYAANAVLPTHQHNTLPAAYVYLNDSPPVIFRHEGKPYGAVTRAATKTGAFRVYKAIEETHEVVNTGSVPSEFLRVEFKTAVGNPDTLTGRFPRLAAPAGENLDKIQFENDQIRISRVIVAPGNTMEIAASATEPSLLISIPSGKEQWLPANQGQRLENKTAEPLEWLRFAFKTRPRA
jgi:hypothetical protein